MNILGDYVDAGFGRDAPKRRLAVVAAALLGFGLTGCQSISPCGLGDPCREPGHLRKLGQRMFNRTPRDAVVVDGCEPGLIGATPYAGEACPPVITSPGVVGSPPPLGAEETPPLELGPVTPPAGSGTNGGASTAPGNSGASNRRGETGRAVYETVQPRSGSVARRDNPPSQPAHDPLANLPSLDPPAELTGVPAVAPEADAIRAPVETTPTAARGESAAAPTNTPPVPDSETSSLAPGIASFKVVEPRLAGGSLPLERGWSWLAEQGYKTVVDLRPTESLRSSDLAAINASGLRYVALPTPDASIDAPAHLARFAAELGQESARPIYFFDEDGARAAVLWYLHQVANQQAIPQEAARNASEIGPRNVSLWARAQAVIDRLQPAKVPASGSLTNAPEPPDSPVPDRESADTPKSTITPAQSPPSSPPSSGALAPAARLAQDSQGVQNLAPSATPPAPARPAADPAAWKPFAALAAAGMSVPIAFVGRSALGRITHVARASLMAPRTSPRAIPAASGE